MDVKKDDLFVILFNRTNQEIAFVRIKEDVPEVDDPDQEDLSGYVRALMDFDVAAVVKRFNNESENEVMDLVPSMVRYGYIEYTSGEYSDTVQ